MDELNNQENEKTESKERRAQRDFKKGLKWFRIKLFGLSLFLQYLLQRYILNHAFKRPLGPERNRQARLFMELFQDTNLTSKQLVKITGESKLMFKKNSSISVEMKSFPIRQI